jgi:hypothetical protein
MNSAVATISGTMRSLAGGGSGGNRSPVAAAARVTTEFMATV